MKDSSFLESSDGRIYSVIDSNYRGYLIVENEDSKLLAWNRKCLVDDDLESLVSKYYPINRGCNDWDEMRREIESDIEVQRGLDKFDGKEMSDLWERVECDFELINNLI